MITPTVAQSTLTCATQLHTHFLNIKNKFTALSSLEKLQELNAFYQSDEKKRFDTLQKRTEDVYNRQSATPQELQNIKDKLAEGTAVLKEMQQITSTAFEECAAQGVFGSIFSNEILISILNTSTIKAPYKTPIFLQKIHHLSDIVKLCADDHPATNIAKVIETLDKLKLHSPYSHIYSMRKQEYEETSSVSSSNYDKKAVESGKNAMTNQYLISNCERRRAIQRAIIELTLEGLDEIVNGTFTNTIQETLEILEKTPMDAKDLPNNGNNPAQILFNEMFNLHYAARKHNSALISLSDSKCNSEFGKHAFLYGNPEEVNPSTKTQAIQATREALKKAWSM